MENPIVKLFNDLSDEEIQFIMDEIIECEKTGIFAMNSRIRYLAKQCSDITRIDVASNLLMVQMNVFRQGALRWVKLKEEKKDGETDRE